MRSCVLRGLFLYLCSCFRMRDSQSCGCHVQRNVYNANPVPVPWHYFLIVLAAGGRGVDHRR